MKEKYNIITICGPTASGKTALAVKLARKYNGEIISGDSRQVYKKLDIGTGKDINEYSNSSGTIPYHLIDIVDPKEDYNLNRYLKDFENAYHFIKKRRKQPILVGGSGLYIEGALKRYDLSKTPQNKELREQLKNTPKHQLIEMLKHISPEYFAKTDISSTKRIIRSIEILQVQKKNDEKEIIINKPPLQPLILAITFPREEIIKRINNRLEERLKNGMVEEVKSLMEEGISYNKMTQLGLEYQYSAMFLKGEISYKEYTNKLKTEIHRFAKRQMTWIRGMPRRGLTVHWLKGNDFTQASKIIDNVGFIE